MEVRTERRVARRYCRLLLGTALAVALAGGLSSTALAKGDGLPLNVRIVGAAGERQIDFVSTGDLDGALAFNNQVVDLEQRLLSVRAHGSTAARTSFR